MTTSNVTGKIDLAFVDRADMKVHIGLPGKEAIYEIFLSSIMELQRTAIVERRGVMVSFWFLKNEVLKFHSKSDQ